MSTLIGRIKEIEKLKGLNRSNKSEFLVVYGRRRVGKTFLIREFYENTFDFQMTGLANADMSQQLYNFYTAIQNQFNVYLETTPSNYLEAFQLLIKELEKIKGKNKKVIFIDELPWLDTAKSDFLLALEHFWNSWATMRKDIVLIGCGSAASWMINKLLQNHGGLHNRVTERIKLNPFTLFETEQFLISKNVNLDQLQIINLYMVMGGIPYYLDGIRPGLSAAQNIDAMCFDEDGILFREYQFLFPSLFRNPDHYEAIVAALAKNKTGINRNEIIDATGLSSGGTLTKKLSELEESGFIKSYIDPGRKNKDTIYRLSDFYCNFYFKFIHGNKIFEKNYWSNRIDNPAQRTWSGYAFEQVCLAHVPQLASGLGIAGVQTNYYVWRSKHSDPGAQIDLVIDRRDQVINLCEIKFSINPYTITKSYAKNIRNKIAVYKDEMKTRKSIFFTMITTFGLKQNEHVGSLVQNQLTMDVLFFS